MAVAAVRAYPVASGVPSLLRASGRSQGGALVDLQEFAPSTLPFSPHPAHLRQHQRRQLSPQRVARVHPPPARMLPTVGPAPSPAPGVGLAQFSSASNLWSGSAGASGPSTPGGPGIQLPQRTGPGLLAGAGAGGECLGVTSRVGWCAWRLGTGGDSGYKEVHEGAHADPLEQLPPQDL